MPQETTTTVQTTVKQFAERFGVEQSVANGTLNFLCSQGHARNIGTVAKAEGQKGKSATLYEVDAEILEVLAKK